MTSQLLEIRHLDKSFGGVTALQDFELNVASGEVVGIIGPNGAGKTTLFNVITGFLEPDAGSVMLRGQEITGRRPHDVARMGVSRTFQKLRLVRQMSVLENVLLWSGIQPGENLGRLFFSYGTTMRVEGEKRDAGLELLEGAKLDAKAADSAGSLSYGQQKLLSIVCCLAADPGLVLLDEPVAGIAPEMIDRMLKTIATLPGLGKTVLLIEHNIEAVMKVCPRVVFMDSGQKVTEGSPDEVRSDSRVIEAYLE